MFVVLHENNDPSSFLDILHFYQKAALELITLNIGIFIFLLQLELILFIKNKDIDVILVSEIHFTDRNAFGIPYFDIYDTKHPSGRAHGDTAIIINS